MSIRIRIRAGYITVISAYAPTLLASDEDKDEFYQQLSDLLSSILAGHDIALLGDFNARIGADADSWTSVIGRFGVGKINENGQRLLELCSLFNLSVASSFFKGSLRSKVTWMHPRSRRWHQLDHAIIRRRQLRGLKQCRSMHSADCGTDHALVRCKLQITLKKFHQIRPKPLPLVDIFSTRDSLRNQHFQQLLSSKLDSANLPDDPNIAWCTTCDVIMSSAFEAYGQRS